MINLFLFSLTSFSFIFFPLLGVIEEYTQPQDVATTEGLACSLVNQSVCAITGEYTDSILDVVIQGPEPLTISRLYPSFSKKQPWSFNHCDKLILGEVIYKGTASYKVALRQPSGSRLDYVFEKKGNFKKLKKMSFKLVTPKGMTNGASSIRGKTNVKNQTLLESKKNSFNHLKGKHSIFAAMSGTKEAISPSLKWVIKKLSQNITRGISPLKSLMRWETRLASHTTPNSSIIMDKEFFKR